MADDEELLTEAERLMRTGSERSARWPEVRSVYVNDVRVCVCVTGKMPQDSLSD